jgi:hypothetical protein
LTCNQEAELSSLISSSNLVCKELWNLDNDISKDTERDVESKPKTSLNNTQPTDESVGIVASKIRQFSKGFRIPDDDEKR